MKHGKKYLEAAKAVDRSIQYDPADAISTVKKLATAKFDETIEVHIKTGCAVSYTHLTLPTICSV